MRINPRLNFGPPDMQSPEPDSLDSLIPISALTLNCGAELNTDIFLKIDATSTPKLYCSRNMAVAPRQVQSLIDAGVTKLYIPSESYDAYQIHLRNNWRSLLSESEVVNRNRTALMSDVVRAVLCDQFTSSDTASVVTTCDELGTAIVHVLSERPVLVTELHDVMCHDYATFTHSSNVACFCASLATELGYSGDELKQIVVGALLHDIGKLEVAEQILTKPGRLDEFEFREVQKHPAQGLHRLLTEQKALTHGQLMMVYQHHEKLNGSGYPVGVPGEEIHPWAKICTVVDIFEALTSHRPYRKPMSHATAFALIDKLSGTELDAEIVECRRTLVVAKA